MSKYMQNSAPWIEPTIVTASGEFAIYLSGIAMNRRMINEDPSIKPEKRNRLIEEEKMG